MAAIATPALPRTRARILIASADAAFRQRVKKDPLYAGWESEEAVGGAHGLAKLMQFPCDSVLLDRNLPDLDAAEVAEQIRKQFPRVEVELLDTQFVSMKCQGTELSEQNRSAGESDIEAEEPAIAQRQLRAFPTSPLRKPSSAACGGYLVL